MNNDDLSQKLDTLQTPEIELAGHRQRLKASLMSEKIPQRRTWYKETLTLIETGLFSRPPVWKTGIAVLVLAGIIVPLSVILTGMNSGSVYAKAMDIVNSSFELQKMLSSGDNQSIIGTISSDKTYVIETDYKDGSIIITFPRGATKPGEPESMQLEAFDKDGNSIPVNSNLKNGTIRVTISKDGTSRAIEVTFENDDT